ncbi:hypothetical protein, partial [Aeromonas veronii]|uniref:hypothetical protein n=1 Tax=Aeromonas veronii TaxID=654 RepID=UPI00196B13EB
ALLGRRRAAPIKARAGKRLTDRPDTLTQTTSGNQLKPADKEQTIHFYDVALHAGLCESVA